MKKTDLEKHKIDQRTKLVFFGFGISTALILGLAGSPYAGEAFALLAGLIGGDSLRGHT